MRTWMGVIKTKQKSERCDTAGNDHHSQDFSPRRSPLDF